TLSNLLNVTRTAADNAAQESQSARREAEQARMAAQRTAERVQRWEDKWEGRWKEIEERLGSQVGQGVGHSAGESQGQGLGQAALSTISMSLDGSDSTPLASLTAISTSHPISNQPLPSPAPIPTLQRASSASKLTSMPSSPKRSDALPGAMMWPANPTPVVTATSAPGQVPASPVSSSSSVTATPRSITPLSHATPASASQLSAAQKTASSSSHPTTPNARSSGDSGRRSSNDSPSTPNSRVPRAGSALGLVGMASSALSDGFSAVTRGSRNRQKVPVVSKGSDNDTARDYGRQYAASEIAGGAGGRVNTQQQMMRANQLLAQQQQQQQQMAMMQWQHAAAMQQAQAQGGFPWMAQQPGFMQQPGTPGTPGTPGGMAMAGMMQYSGVPIGIAMGQGGWMTPQGSPGGFGGLVTPGAPGSATGVPVMTVSVAQGSPAAQTAALPMQIQMPSFNGHSMTAPPPGSPSRPPSPTLSDISAGGSVGSERRGSGGIVVGAGRRKGFGGLMR
ncbi:hypothetical protein HDU93_000426, partial [Gonapodya sp. JEL0774]